MLGPRSQSDLAADHRNTRRNTQVRVISGSGTIDREQPLSSVAEIVFCRLSPTSASFHGHVLVIRARAHSRLQSLRFDLPRSSARVRESMHRLSASRNGSAAGRTRGGAAEGGQPSELPIAPRRERKVSMVRAKTNLRPCGRFIGAGSARG